jgi:hypothetical protein
MKTFYTFISAFILAPLLMVAQAPTLGTTAQFVLFSTNGAVTNVGITQLTGKVGTNNGSNTGFGNVNGGMHAGDTNSAQAAVDLLIAYNQLNAAIATFFPAPLLGNGQTLNAGIYSISAAATLNGNLNLDAQQNPNAVFIIKIQGPFSTNANAKVNLLNGAQACNVFWKVEGLVDMAAGTTLRGTIIANNAGINMNANDTLEGRAMTTAGAISVNGTMAYTPSGCGSPVLNGPTAPVFGRLGCFGLFSADGPVQNAGITTVKGDVGANVGLTTGFDTLLVTGKVRPIPDTATASAAAELILVYNLLNVLPADIELVYPAQFGRNLVLTPHTYVLNGATALTDTLFLNAQGVASAVFIIKIFGALQTSSYAKVVLQNGAKAENVFWLVNGAVNIADYSILNGTVLAQGAVSLLTGARINGRVWTGVGALTANAMTSAATIDTTACATSGPPTSVAQALILENVTLYPNPFKQELSIRIENSQTQLYSLRITNALGVEVIRQQLTQDLNTVEVGHLASGMYFYQLSNGTQLLKTGKLIAE